MSLFFLMQIKNVVSEESDKGIDMDDKSDASPISSNITKEEETDTYGSQTEGMAFFSYT